MIRKVLLAFVAVLMALIAWEWLTWPDVDSLTTTNPETTAFIERRKRELKRAGKEATIRQTWVSYEAMAPALRRAVVVSEDNAFFDHEGFDRKELEESVRRNLRERRLTRGGSTITQQLAKNLWLSPSKNPWRKVKELLLARQLEQALSKKRILEIYLNVVEFGETVYGAEAASRHYFDKSARNLSTREAALLAGSLPNPRVMNPGDPNSRLRARQKIILSRMKRWGGVVDEELQRSSVPERPAARPEPEPAAEPSAAVEEVEPAEPDDELPEPAEPPAQTVTDPPELPTTEPPIPDTSLR